MAPHVAQPSQPDIIVRNTAQRIMEGQVIVHLVDDLPAVDDQAAWIRDRINEFPGETLTDAKAIDAAVKKKAREGRVLIHPRMGEAYILNDAWGFDVPQDSSNEIYVRWVHNKADAINIIVHEASHALNSPAAERFSDDAAMQNAWEIFVTEARAYWVADNRNVTGSLTQQVAHHYGSDARGALAKENAMKSHPTVQAYFDSNEDFQNAVRLWDPATGNVEHL